MTIAIFRDDTAGKVAERVFLEGGVQFRDQAEQRNETRKLASFVENHVNNFIVRLEEEGKRREVEMRKVEFQMA